MGDVPAWVGTVGGLAGLASLALSVASYRRDRARVRVDFIQGWTVTGGAEADELARDLIRSTRQSGLDVPRALYYRDPDISWDEIRVSNVGRRPIRIEKVGFVVSARPPYEMIADFEAKSIGEGENVCQLVNPDARPSESAILAAFAFDGTARNHYGSFARGFTGLIARAKASLGLAPFVR